jgi:hypothetical protein
MVINSKVVATKTKTTITPKRERGGQSSANMKM